MTVGTGTLDKTLFRLAGKAAAKAKSSQACGPQFTPVIVSSLLSFSGRAWQWTLGACFHLMEIFILKILYFGREMFLGFVEKDKF